MLDIASDISSIKPSIFTNSASETTTSKHSMIELSSYLASLSLEKSITPKIGPPASIEAHFPSFVASVDVSTSPFGIASIQNVAGNARWLIAGCVGSGKKSRDLQRPISCHTLADPSHRWGISGEIEEYLGNHYG